MGEEDTIPPTLLQKLLFYTTATFVILAIFSLFAFLFLVPFVIDPAFTTIFMQFEPVAAFCVTAQVNHLRGVSNCSWASCREGCTKDLYECTQIRVNYKLGEPPDNSTLDVIEEGVTERRKRALRDYEYETYDMAPVDSELQAPMPTGLQGNDSEWFFTGARLYPNVKGCGYPPILNCTIFLNKYRTVGTNYTCYYSKVDPGLVMSDLDMWQNTLNLVYAMAIPIPTFIISVIYLAVAYFKIYSKDVEAEEAPLQDDAEAMATGEAGEGQEDKPTTPGSDTFREDLASFGHQFKRPSEKSHESFENHNSAPISNSGSVTG